MNSIALLVSLSLGCMSADRFSADYAEAGCQYADDCGFLDLYGSKDDCIATLEDQAMAVVGDCDLDHKKARDCLSAVGEAECAVDVESATADCQDLCK